MPQRFQIHDSHPWLPLLLIFGSALYALVEVMDRGLGAVSFWFLIPVVAIAFFLFRSRKNYVELAEGHLTWVQGGHKVRRIAFSEIGQVRRDGRFVNIYLPNDPAPRRRLHVFGRATAAGWVSIPAADPEGLFSSVEQSLHTYGRRDLALESSLESANDEPPAAPQIELVPATRWRRVLAMALDAFFLVSLLFTVALALTAHLENGEEPDGNLTLWALVVAIAGIVYVWLSNVIGISLGKLQIGLRTVRVGSEQPPGPVVGTVRTVAVVSAWAIPFCAAFFIRIDVRYAAGFLFLIDFGWSLVDGQRRAVHDIVARTRVMQTAYRQQPDQREGIGNGGGDGGELNPSSS
jgi:uncharacterized RDD family membrane protein YckC